VDRDLSPKDGAITLPSFNVGGWYWRTFTESGYLDPDLKPRDYGDEQAQRFLHGPSGS